MLFNSIPFLFFFVIVVFLYFALPHRFRWAFLLAASYFFYMCWEPEYAILIFITTFIVYLSGLLMHKRPKRVKRLYLILSLLSNLGILFIFKYYNFFNNSLKELFTAFNLGYHVPALNVLLPVGISFYTFQALSYSIDIYRDTREPEKHFGIFALYVSFFPQLVAGPIERSTTLLPQLREKKVFDYDRVTDGLKLMAWGFFQKLVIADRLGLYVNQVYGNPQGYHGLPLLVATYFFVFQVYCDFSGYTDIAIGAAKIMGYDLMPNFKRPYFSSSTADLWRKWHMSLIMWFRDYVYIPLGGNRVPKWRYYVNIVLVFFLSGLWHGAQWTFVAWGTANGIFIVIGQLTEKFRDKVRNFVYWVLFGLHPAVYSITGLACIAAGIVLPISRGGAKAMWAGRIAMFTAALILFVVAFLKFKKIGFQGFIDRMKKLFMILITFQLFVFSAIFFRAKTISDGWYILTGFPGKNIDEVKLGFNTFDFSIMVVVIVFLNVIHLLQERGSIRQMLKTKPLVIRWAVYYIMVILIFLGIYRTSQFIYFQF